MANWRQNVNGMISEFRIKYDDGEKREAAKILQRMYSELSMVSGLARTDTEWTAAVEEYQAIWCKFYDELKAYYHPLEGIPCFDPCHWR